MSFPRYAEYTDSGVEWLGPVPPHWRVAPLKSVANVINGYPFDSKLFDPSGPHPLVRIRDLNQTTTDSRYAGDFVDAAAVDSTDVLIGMDGDFNVGRWLGEGRALLNQRMCCVRSTDPMITRFLEYALPFPLQAINDVTYSTTVKHLSSFDVLKIRLALPGSTQELGRVVAFLDRETAKIDALVEEQKRLIELLKEKRQAVISQAVTKGLDLNVPKKDSGVEWLGQIPAPWKVVKLKHITSQVTVGIVVEPSKYYVDEGVPALRSLNVRQEGVNAEGMINISVHGHALHQKSLLRAGDLVAVRSGQPGTTAVIPTELDGCNCIDLIVIRRPVSGSERFLCWFMNSDSARIQYTQGSGGAIQQHFNVEAASNLVIAWPPANEQEHIASRISAAVEECDSLVRQASEGVKLLQERRSSLISAAVTGKIDVRDLGQRPHGDEPSSRHDESHDLQCERSNAGAHHVAHHRQ